MAAESVGHSAMNLRQEMDTRARHAQPSRSALQVLLYVDLAIAGCNREAQAGVRAQRDAALASEEGMPKTGSAQERAFQELGVFRHGRSFMRPTGPVKQVSMVESELWQSNLVSEASVRS
jgi:hypothetical protein